MKKAKMIVLVMSLMLSLSSLIFCSSSDNRETITLAKEGTQPSLDRDSNGTVGITYGNGKDIYFASSGDNGKTFNIDKVGTQNGLVLGMSSGTRLALGEEFYTIVAPNKGGDLLAWRKKVGIDIWEGPFAVNELPGSVGESLADIAYDDGTLYAIWIDTRRAMEDHAEMDHEMGKREPEMHPELEKSMEQEPRSHEMPTQLTKEEIMAEVGEMPEGAEGIRQYPGLDGKMYWVVLDKEGNALKAKDMESYNAFKMQNEGRRPPEGKIYLSKSDDGGMTWSKSQLVYTSPDGSVCECCMPTIKAENASVYVMFRNNLKGSRDLYLTTSADKGTTFEDPQKLGFETWPLNGCPTDGGGLLVSNNEVSTIWQRKGQILFAQPGEKEELIGSGRSPAIDSGSKGNYIAWNEGSNIMVKTPQNSSPLNIGSGSSPKVLSVDNGEAVLIIWVDSGEIKVRRLA